MVTTHSKDSGLLLKVTNSYGSPAYENLQFYKNICEIRKIVYGIAEKFKKTHLRLASQMQDAARSAKQNIREGYAKDSAGEFANSIRISKGSISELEGDIDDCKEDGLINAKDYAVLKTLILKTIYQIDKYMDALYKLEKDGKWKTRFKRTR
jgi:four helix bundle protein